LPASAVRRPATRAVTANKRQIAGAVSDFARVDMTCLVAARGLRLAGVQFRQVLGQTRAHRGVARLPYGGYEPGARRRHVTGFHVGERREHIGIDVQRVQRRQRVVVLAGAAESFRTMRMRAR